MPWIDTLKVLLSGVLTAVLVFVLNAISNNAKEKTHYKNLVAIVNLELFTNYLRMVYYEKHGLDLPIDFRTEDWERVKLEIARRLPKNLFASLVTTYYELNSYRLLTMDEMANYWSRLKTELLTLNQELKKISGCRIEEITEQSITKAFSSIQSNV